MAYSPLNDKSMYVHFSIHVDGKQIDDTYRVNEIEVSKAVNRIPKAHVLIYDGSASKSDFEISNTQTFVPGGIMEISAGYESGFNTLFKGIIIKHELQLRDGKSFLVIECRDEALKMTTNRKNAFYKKQKDSDIITSLINNTGLTSEVDSTNVEHKEVVQYYVSDWDFMLIRAEINGMLVYVSDGKVSVQKPNFSVQSGLRLTYGMDIIDFNAVMNAELQMVNAVGYSWSSEDQKTISAEGDTPNYPNQGNIKVKTLSDVVGPQEYRLQSSGSLHTDQLKGWATSKKQLSGLTAYRCRFKFQGSEKAVVGSMIEIAGMGDRFNGKAFISSVRHIIKDGDWLTEIETGMSGDFFSEEVMNIESLPVTGLNASVRGFHYGKVKQIHEDPDGETRVLLTMPIMENDDGIWARLSTLYASNNSGTFFIPEIDDEVLVGFMNDDPSFPVILGSLYSKKINAPYIPDNKNSVKAIVTKNQLKIEFEDDKKIITIETPGKNIIRFSDDEKSITITDQHNNKVELSAEGIVLDSQSNIHLKALEDINIEAIGNITMKASENIDISGLAISSSANTSYSASGNASAEFSSSGTCTVKGAMVMIN
ncbi:type VI secretion system tip protein VgrG [Rhodohalobacter sulfatireducens]|uniref:Type VI secretion system tip protein VgrG n=1 Tax=Rhodohalobacter sulfatireducens TaxID=2911366 RepID=A0ABS9KIA8_9BACT|nr:type VI secretion system tip protein VgrG [Rhodohalobacter sulfatireducens]MCG2590565.1 type VI secretion system tip protein VgrG [Rhodohalobacter sulfatireducens]